MFCVCRILCGVVVKYGRSLPAFFDMKKCNIDIASGDKGLLTTVSEPLSLRRCCWRKGRIHGSSTITSARQPFSRRFEFLHAPEFATRVLHEMLRLLKTKGTFSDAEHDTVRRTHTHTYTQSRHTEPLYDLRWSVVRPRCWRLCTWHLGVPGVVAAAGSL